MQENENENENENQFCDFQKKKSGGQILRGLCANFLQKLVNTFCCRVVYNPETDLKISRLLIRNEKNPDSNFMT